MKSWSRVFIRSHFEKVYVVSSVPSLFDLTASGFVAYIDGPQKSLPAFTVSKKRVCVPSLTPTTVKGNIVTLIPSDSYLSFARTRGVLKTGFASKRRFRKMYLACHLLFYCLEGGPLEEILPMFIDELGKLKEAMFSRK